MYGNIKKLGEACQWRTKSVPFAETKKVKNAAANTAVEPGEQKSTGRRKQLELNVHLLQPLQVVMVPAIQVPVFPEVAFPVVLVPVEEVASGVDIWSHRLVLLHWTKVAPSGGYFPFLKVIILLYSLLKINWLSCFISYIIESLYYNSLLYEIR